MGDSNLSSIFSYIAEGLRERQIAFLSRCETGEDSPLDRRLRTFQGPVFVSNGLSVDDWTRLVRNGIADAVAFGGNYIATPDLSDSIAAGMIFNTPNPPTFCTGNNQNAAAGYTNYPVCSITL